MPPAQVTRCADYIRREGRQEATPHTFVMQKVIGMAKQSFRVSGMHCPSCEKVLQMDIGDIGGVRSVKADFRTGSVEVEGEGFDPSAVKRAITQNGYKVQ